MKISEKIRKLQELPENKRKIILWSVVIVLGSVFFIGWARNLQQNLKTFPKEEIIEEFRTPLLKRLQDMYEHCFMMKAYELCLQVMQYETRMTVVQTSDGQMRTRVEATKGGA